MSCSVEGLGERVPIKLIEGKERNALLKSQGLEKAAIAEPLKFVTLNCNRRLTPASKIQLVYGKGVSTPSGVPNSVEKRYNYQVREPFSASFNCERETAQSACLPIRPMSLNFNAPVARKLAEGIPLTGGKDALKPTFEGEGDGAEVVNSITFKPLFNESTPYVLELPKDFKDASGRTLRNADSFPLKVTTGAMPPLAKFAAAPFGIVERYAEPHSLPGDMALLPVTLRNVEAALQIKGLAPGKVSDLQPKTDVEIIAWFRKVQRYDRYEVPRKLASNDVKGALPKVLEKRDKDTVQSRVVSLLQGQPGVKTLDLPKPVSSEGEEESAASQNQRVIAAKLPLTLDKNGAGFISYRHNQPQTHGGRLLYLRQQNRGQRFRPGVQRQKRRTRAAIV